MDRQYGIPGKPGHFRFEGTCAAPQDPVQLGYGSDFSLKTYFKSSPDKNHQTYLLWPSQSWYHRLRHSGPSRAMVPGCGHADAAPADGA